MNRELKPMRCKSLPWVARIGVDVESFTRMMPLLLHRVFSLPREWPDRLCSPLGWCVVMLALIGRRARALVARNSKSLRSAPGLLAILAGLQHAQPVLAFGAQGHEFSAAVADRLLNRRAASEVARTLGRSLQVASTWADCIRDVQRREHGWRYVPDARFHRACQAFETSEGIARMIDFVSRNSTQCDPGGRQTACHKKYHFTDVAIQRDHYDRGFIGSSDHDVVSALQAAINVLHGRPAAAPFSIRNRREALLLLAHLVGDVHQPLHVGALYLDAEGQPLDPDAAGAPLDPKTATRGGNSIADGTSNLHAEWDTVAAHLQAQHIDRRVLAEARSIAADASDPVEWPEAWASETLLVSRATFEGLVFQSDIAKPGQWRVQFADRFAYFRQKDVLQTRQLIRAGARLAQVLNALWPEPGQATRPSARRIFSGVNGCENTAAPNGRNASLMAFITAPGAPAVPASPAPLAPSLELAVGVCTWATTMSGISPAIGTR